MRVKWSKASETWPLVSMYRVIFITHKKQLLVTWTSRSQGKTYLRNAMNKNFGSVAVNATVLGDVLSCHSSAQVLVNRKCSIGFPLIIIWMTTRTVEVLLLTTFDCVPLFSLRHHG